MKELCKEPWDADYIDKIGEDRQLLYDLILAANYMVRRHARWPHAAASAERLLSSRWAHIEFDR